MENVPETPAFTIMKTFAKYLWPKNDLGTKVRVVVAVSLLLGSKLVQKRRKGKKRDREGRRERGRRRKDN